MARERQSRESSRRGAFLQTARKAAGLRQEDVARELCEAGLLTSPRHQTISEWELGKSEPSFDQLTWLRERYGFDWNDLFSRGERTDWEAAYLRAAKVVGETNGGTSVVGEERGFVDFLAAAARLRNSAGSSAVVAEVAAEHGTDSLHAAIGAVVAILTPKHYSAEEFWELELAQLEALGVFRPDNVPPWTDAQLARIRPEPTG